MAARVKEIEVNPVPTSISQTLDALCDAIVPALCGQPGMQGLYVIPSPEGKAVVVTLWDTEEAADAGLDDDVADEQVKRLFTVYTASSDGSSYDVGLFDASARRVS